MARLHARLTADASAVAVAAQRGNAVHIILHSLTRDRVALCGCTTFILVLLAALIGPYAYPYDPLQQDLAQRLMPAFWRSAAGEYHMAGTDQLGRDLLSRLLLGARISLLVGFSAVLIGGCLGTLLGVLAGYFGGGIDRVVTRLADAQLAIPYILFAIAVMAVLGPELKNLILVLGFTGWVAYARIVRSSVLTIRERECILAARSIGASNARIILHYVLPSSMDLVIVIASSQLATMIVAEASLSFLGLGIPAPNPSWGNMLADGRNYLTTAWWLATLPGLALTITILAINIVGDWVRDLLDPRLRTGVQRSSE